MAKANQYAQAVPGDGGKATSICIPRDDYVDLDGCPDNQCKGKIKQAYGLPFDAKAKQLAAQGATNTAQREQQAREAGRKAEIDTVRQFLGGVTIDHFVEVALVAFFQIAQVVQPVTVCVNEDTQDSYSGTNFHKGQKQINAEQAVTFGRQRRDNVHPSLNFTDLDRERRQQAFIASLAYQLKQAGTFTERAKLQGNLTVAKQNTAVDANLDLLLLARQAFNLTSGNVTFVTLPIDHFGKDPIGEDVNIVNLAQVRATVSQLLGTSGNSGSTSTAATPAASSGPSATVDVMNATSRNGLAVQVQQLLAAQGYSKGHLSTDSHHLSRSTVYYGSNASTAANAIAGALGGLTSAADTDVPAGHVRVVIGADVSPPAPNHVSSTPSTPPPSTPDTANALSALSGGGIPCVK
ncbi:LCP family protein [Amycolatopsis sp. GM8]|uniref:LCP family protein n=1 Tax=Amycolatopsis sp. GM8 TaxID=2896530 RepID=UPI001F367F38|nr:LCP family protein [Amycolatopsis sp. GM8]